MSTPIHALALAAAVALLAGGCARETLREMGSLKDGLPTPAERQSAESASARAEQDEEAVHEVAVDGETGRGSAIDGRGSAIETGTLPDADARGANCQGAHVAYQATREYLKNFGPRPQDLPGEKGPCLPDAR